MTFREHLLYLDPNLLVEGEEYVDMSPEDILAEIKSILDEMDEDEIDELGAFLSVEFFDVPEDDIEETYFDAENILEMIEELGEDMYEVILDLILPEDFTNSADLEDEEEAEVSEGVSRVMKAKRRNMKKRKFFQKSAATLRKERAARMKANRMNRASRKAYTRVNKAKLASYQKSRAKFMRKGKHFAKIRRQAGE